jgi:hypothetical protein
MPIISKTPFLRGSTTKTETKSALPVILILFAVIGGLLFYFQILKPSQVNEYEILPDLQKEYSSFKAFKNLSLDFSIFNRIDFKELRIFGEVPVRPSPAGKTDLFGP